MTKKIVIKTRDNSLLEVVEIDVNAKMVSRGNGNGFRHLSSVFVCNYQESMDSLIEDYNQHITKASSHLAYLIMNAHLNYDQHQPIPR